MKRRSDLHLARKTYHVLGVLFILFAYLNLTRSVSLQVCLIATLVFIVFDLLRLQIPAVNRVIIYFFRPFMRESERHAISGTTHLLLGTFIIMVLFSKNIVILSLLFLGLADPIASYVGIRYGRDKIIGQKSLQGTLAAFASSGIISAIYFLSFHLMTDRLLIVSLFAGVIGAISELIPLGRLDDNLSFPVISSILLYGLFYLFGGF